jgi:multimeric flavodoxin WrbA
MYAIGINGSPRKGGNTEMLVNTVLGGLKGAGWGTEFVQLGGEAIRGCQACSKCFKAKDGKCAFQDDVFQGIYDKAMRADAIIVGTPTYYSGVTAEVKALTDRMGYVALANGRALKGKVGAAVVAVRRGGATHAFDTINHMFLMSQMVVPGSIYWNIGFGLRREDVKDDKEGLTNVRILADTIHLVAGAIRPLAAQWPEASGY